MRLDSPDDKQRVGASPSSSPFTDILKLAWQLASSNESLRNHKAITMEEWFANRDAGLLEAEAAILRTIQDAIGPLEPEYSNLDGDAGYWEKHGRNEFRKVLWRKLGINGEGKPHGDSK